MERILQTMIKQTAAFPVPPHPFIFLIPLGEASLSYTFQLLCKLRHAKIPAEIDLSGKKMQHGLQLANHLQANYCLIIGEEELTKQIGKLKEMATRDTIDVPLEKLIAKLKELKDSHV